MNETTITSTDPTVPTDPAPTKARATRKAAPKADPTKADPKAARQRSGMIRAIQTCLCGVGAATARRVTEQRTRANPSYEPSATVRSRADRYNPRQFAEAIIRLVELSENPETKGIRNSPTEFTQFGFARVPDQTPREWLDLFLGASDPGSRFPSWRGLTETVRADWRTPSDHK